MIIAIDGPAGSGKSTVAKLAADKLSFKYVDTGAMYRAVTADVLDQGIALDDEASIVAVASRTDLLNIAEQRIRTPEVSRAVAIVAKLSAVRNIAMTRQREIAKDHNIVMEGRDIGSVVFPDAELKIYLNATVEERAKRRFEELTVKGVKISLQQIEQDIALRDRTDSEREHSPLRLLPDAVEIDTTGLGIEEVVERICAEARLRMKRS
ncbi:MAG: (d)CMP kinase [Candidatus Margulisiibacteriota bacterium]|jgi:cytidylate kinase